MDGPAHEPGHARIAFQPGRCRAFGGCGLRPPVQPRSRRQLHPGLAQGRQDLVDVAQEGGIGTDHQYPLSFEGEAVGVQQVRGAVQGHRRLARAGPALHYEHPGQRRPDDLVLFGLDGGDDVAHTAGVRPAQGGHEHARAAEPERLRRPLGTARSEKFVLDVEQVPAFGEEMPTAAQAHGVGARGPVERFGHRRPPVHHQRFVVGVR